MRISDMDLEELKKHRLDLIASAQKIAAEREKNLNDFFDGTIYDANGDIWLDACPNLGPIVDSLFEVSVKIREIQKMASTT